MSFFSTLLHTNTKCKVGGGPRPPSFVCCNDHEAIGHTDRYFTKSIIDTIYRGFLRAQFGPNDEEDEAALAADRAN